MFRRRFHDLTLWVGLLLVACPLTAQDKATTKPTKKSPALPRNWTETLAWRSIGPANMSGRITALAVYEKDPSIWWAASASGGLLKTTNNGITFQHQFDHQATVSIGDVQVAPSDSNIVWVGTGEANPRNSVSWGDGVYKSADGGKTWKNMGLKKSFQIGRIAIHPTNPNTVYVGALGRLWGPSDERGLFKTTDGGKTWKRILFVDNKTGVIDVRMDPSKPDSLLVATYERQRDGTDSNDPAKKFGPGAALYKTTNGGKTFRKITKGLPTGPLGRIGICYYKKDSRHVYLVLESEKIGQWPPKSPYLGIRAQDAEVGARIIQVVAKGPAERAGVKESDIVISVEGKVIHSYNELLQEVRKHQAGDKIKWQVVRDRKGVDVEITLGKRPEPKKGRQDKNQPKKGEPKKNAPKTNKPKKNKPDQPQSAADRKRAGSPFAVFLGGQRENVQDQQGPHGDQYGGIYHSQDGGQSWTRINSVNPRPMYYSQIRVDPTDRNTIWVLGTQLHLSKDGGTTFSTKGLMAGVHPDHHAMWIDPRDGRHVILGNDGGLYVTYDRGQAWDHHNHVAIGQFYHVAVGPRRDYRVYGGLQDNGSWGGPNRSASGNGPINTDWIRIGGGDGFICAVDRDDPDLVYFESQGGATGRINLRTSHRAMMRPRPPKGVKYRFNWKTPFILSPHNPKIYYSAGNFVFQSFYEGNHLKTISPEISRTDQGAGSALAESPVEAGVLYVGTTDGALWVTRDGGHNWTCLYGKSTKKETNKPTGKKDAAGKPSPTKAADKGKTLGDFLPGPRWISCIETSHFKAGRVYITIDGHRSNDDYPYVLTSENYGQTWTSLSSALPASVGTTRVVREDPRNEQVLYLGTEFGIWASIDRGATWTRINNNLPTVAIHEIAIQPAADEIVVATHGRSLWILDAAAIRQMSATVSTDPVHLYRPTPAVIWQRKPSRGSSGTRQFVGQNPSYGAAIWYSLAKKAGEVNLKIVDIQGKTIREIEGDPKAGLHRLQWDLRQTVKRRDRAQKVIKSTVQVEAGKYLAILIVDDQEYKQVVTVEKDLE